ncbi:HlyD family secretion protein [Thalassotalea sp. LPB0316]|uniref:HlyD family secretion protein n=1 Tax=Thalassotalea sp. LPB0316 TaxID=2769490 RepID=UPI0018688531|nr:efflux RND transporter periplasmic adaptor subunit [Thalassotalea sp. LPB0316]QOL27181.1 HlyD family secretion protein [Thalassotalea sp. LPB0316]
MLVFCTIIFIALLFVLIKINVLPNSSKTWALLVPFEFFLILGFFIPLQWGAPAADVRALAYTVPITPNVAGQVTEVLVEPNVEIQKGQPLFTIDPTQYEAALEGLQAQLALAKTRLKQSEELAKQDAGSIYELQAYQAQVQGLEAQIKNAQWNLDETVVKAPTDGIVTNLALRPGQRVVNAPNYMAMSFTDTSEIILGSQVLQNFSRNIKPGNIVEVTFKAYPGKVYAGEVVHMIPATAQGQFANTGMNITPQSNQAGPFFVKIKLDDEAFQNELIPGSMGTAAIYTENVQMAHVIRKVMIRMDAIMNFVKP